MTQSRLDAFEKLQLVLTRMQFELHLRYWPAAECNERAKELRDELWDAIGEYRDACLDKEPAT